MAGRTEVQPVGVEPTVQYSAAKKRSDASAADARLSIKGEPLGPRRRSWFPIMFERAASGWWNTKFDSPILEAQHQKSTFPMTRRRFQVALSYVALSCVSWAVFFVVMRQAHWIAFFAGSIFVLVIALATLGFSFTKFYQRYTLLTSVVLTILLCSFSLANFFYETPDISAVGIFTGTIEILLMMYTVIPMPLYLAGVMGVLYSLTFEILTGFASPSNQLRYIIGRVLLHLAIHLIGIHICIMTQVRKRSTFLKVGQSVLSRRDLEVEKSLKEKMIHSLMPPAVAAEILKTKDERDKKNSEQDEDIPKTPDPQHPQKGQMTFRSFHMSQMENTSILFADIVGFTKMSSNKTAEHLVSLLNDLFGRFDILCTRSGCEKISTLGDCYYCVSGCPEPKADHAKCCVEMGLGMVKAIKEFDEDHKEEVNMRVGVHTGTVLCGLVGKCRFKFDVWSNDVTLANLMESEGEAGRVHISEPTYKFVMDEYSVQKHKEVEDIRKHKVLIEYFDSESQSYKIKHTREDAIIQTYLVTERKPGNTSTTPKAPRLPCKPAVKVSTSDAAGSPEQQRAAADSDNPETQPLLMLSAVDYARMDSTSSIAQLCEDCFIQNSDLVDMYRRRSAANVTTLPAMEAATSSTNHVESQTGEAANGLTTAALLGVREKTSVSHEDLTESTEERDVEEPSLILSTFKQQTKQDRDEADRQLVECVSHDKEAETYLHRPPINRRTLNFLDNSLESSYRKHFVKAGQYEDVPTFSSPRFSAFFDVIVSFLFFALVSGACFLIFPVRIPWLVVFGVATAIELFMFIPLLYNVCVDKKMALGGVGTFLASWAPRHVFGAIAASIPALAVYSNFMCGHFRSAPLSDVFYCLVLIVSLLHYCNFTMLSSWLKSGLASIATLCLLILVGISVCSLGADPGVKGGPVNQSDVSTYSVGALQTEPLNVSIPVNSTLRKMEIFGGSTAIKIEVILSTILLLVLIWFLNREFEIAYRLSFHGNVQAAQDRNTVHSEKEQADWLLHNIIPAHVSDVLKKTSKYCKNHSDVGVIFAKVVNFEEFYDESFEGGREYLRVLNELLNDMEDLFFDPRFKDVEKIKTIGACLMAASGLNPQTRNQNNDPNAHLYSLMEFSMELLNKLEQFNAEIFNFDFEMSIGFNSGEVTSGVIGTTKLLYDIWGDTVNISSRMYSTGVSGRIQVPEYIAKKLEKCFEFEYRDEVFVKGKGNMKTYLLVRKKDGATWS